MHTVRSKHKGSIYDSVSALQIGQRVLNQCVGIVTDSYVVIVVVVNVWSVGGYVGILYTVARCLEVHYGVYGYGIYGALGHGPVKSYAELAVFYLGQGHGEEIPIIALAVPQRGSFYLHYELSASLFVYGYALFAVLYHGYSVVYVVVIHETAHFRGLINDYVFLELCRGVGILYVGFGQDAVIRYLSRQAVESVFTFRTGIVIFRLYCLGLVYTLNGNLYLVAVLIHGIQLVAAALFHELDDGAVFITRIYILAAVCCLGEAIIYILHYAVFIGIVYVLRIHRRRYTAVAHSVVFYVGLTSFRQLAYYRRFSIVRASCGHIYLRRNIITVGFADSAVTQCKRTHRHCRHQYRHRY